MEFKKCNHCEVLECAEDEEERLILCKSKILKDLELWSTKVSIRDCFLKEFEPFIPTTEEELDVLRELACMNKFLSNF